jgi:hypothetical protein
MSSSFLCLSQADANGFLRLIKQFWNKNTDETTESRAASTVVINGSASELLRVAISIDHIKHEAIKDVIKYIQNGKISGKSAIYCISEVRIAIFSQSSSEKLTESNALLEATESICDIAEICINPFFEANTSTLHLQGASSCLDLFPAVINILSTLCKRIKQKKSTQVLDTLMHPRNQWHPQGLLPICCAISELFIHLNLDHLEKLKVALISVIICLR